MAKKIRRALVYPAVAAMVLIGGLIAFVSCTPTSQLPTYFSYTSDELASLRQLSSDRRMAVDDLFEWQDAIFDLVHDEKIGRGSAKRMLVYLVVAQRDSAYLSFNAHRQFQGSIDPVSREVACIFIPEVCEEIPVETDAYSELLAEIVLRKVESRIQEAKSVTATYEMKVGGEYWDNGGPVVVSQMTWLIDSPGKFRVPPPPAYESDADENQVQMVRDAVANLTPEQRLAVLRWAGTPLTIGTNAHWLNVSTKYMRDVEFSDLAAALMIRSVLQMTVMDARIAVDDSKLTHLVKRPFTRFAPDDPIYTVMPTPDGPGYPSTSMTVAGALATIMSYYIPENTDGWNATAREIGDSRVWSGVHFPMDPEQGAVLGRRVGLASLKAAEPVDALDFQPRYEPYVFDPGEVE